MVASVSDFLKDLDGEPSISVIDFPMYILQL